MLGDACVSAPRRSSVLPAGACRASGAVASAVEDAALTAGRRASALSWVELSVVAAAVSVLPGPVDEAIRGAVDRGSIDLLVMGAYGHSRIRQLIVGSTTTALLRLCSVPVVVLR